MKSYILADAAREDLFEIWDYLAAHAGLEVADRIAADLHATMRRLADGETSGHLRDDLTVRSIRFQLVHSYYVIYEPETNPLAIARVIHASRNVQAILEER